MVNGWKRMMMAVAAVAMLGLIGGERAAWSQAVMGKAAPGGAAASGEVSSPAADAPVYRLGSGDRLRVTVFGESDLSGEFQVDGGGTISMPLIGIVRASGLTVRELERAVTAALSDGYLRRPQVSIGVLNYRPFYILGEVQQPGSYPYVDGMTVLNAVVLAGGYTYRARTTRLTLKRASEAEEREVDEQAVVLPGDIIRVPERFF